MDEPAAATVEATVRPMIEEGPPARLSRSSGHARVRAGAAIERRALTAGHSSAVTLK